MARPHFNPAAFSAANALSRRAFPDPGVALPHSESWM
jgi:hypothetical protein